MIATDDLLRNLEDLPAQQAVALRVLHVGGDPRSSSTDLAAAVMGDPVITAQVIKLANSAYYGLSGRIATVAFAVTVVGFASIRSIVAAFAAGALGDDAEVPDRFWERTVAAAASSSIVGASIGAPCPESFSIGLLHDLGDFLLFRAAPEAHAEVHARVGHWDCTRRAILERRLFGMDHGEALGSSLAAWSFPEELVAAMSGHAAAHRLSPPLERVLVGGQAVAGLALRPDAERRQVMEDLVPLAWALDVTPIPQDRLWAMSRQARADAHSLAASFETS
jgi:HD-like signal output (HDOD) protein